MNEDNLNPVATPSSAAPAPATPPMPASPASEPPVPEPTTMSPELTATAPESIAPTPEAPSTSSFNLVKTLIDFIAKPVSTIKSALPALTDFKNSALLGAIVAGVYAITTLIATMFNAVYEKSCSLFTSECTTEWDFDNLSDISYFQTLATPLISIFVAIAALSGLYLALARILKQTSVNYSRLFGIYSIALLPSALATIVSPLLRLIYTPLGMIISLVATSYSALSLYEGLSLEIPLEGDKKVYLHLLAVTSVLVLVFIVLSLLLKNLSSSLGGFDFSDYLSL